MQTLFAQVLAAVDVRLRVEALLDETVWAKARAPKFRRLRTNRERISARYIKQICLTGWRAHTITFGRPGHCVTALRDTAVHIMYG